jgi:hypothetical protein
MLLPAGHSIFFHAVEAVTLFRQHLIATIMMHNMLKLTEVIKYIGDTCIHG